MTRKAKMILIVLMLSSIGFSAMADKGIGKKSKARVSLNINAGNSLRNSIALNLKTGLKYTGSLLVNQQVNGTSYLNNTLLTYQKGNTVYIIPHKQIFAVPDMKQGYTGMKLIIKPH
ncbi:MAG: hypothetical protein IPL84_09375 [Chitinophagaceae bacterium]|nr:hypothetical protein [Chitinophagaceae bacterium]